MRNLLVVLTLMVALTGCALGSAAPHGPSPYEQPLQARIYPPGIGGPQHLSFYLSRPAYVAIFEIIPGRGVGLIHPGYGGHASYAGGGFQNVWLGLSSWRWMYQPNMVGFATHQPRYLYLIASEQPLRVAEFAANPTALRSALGFHQFASWNPYHVMDELVHLVVPYHGSGDWTTDLYIQWPEPPRQAEQYAAQQMTTIRCPDGRTLRIPLGAVGSAAVLCAPVQSHPPVQEEQTDSVVTRPDRRRPQPTPPAVADAETVTPPGPAESDRVRPRPVRPAERPLPADVRGGEPRPAPAEREARERPRPEPQPVEPRREPVRERPAPTPPAQEQGQQEPRPAPRPEAQPAREVRPEPRPAVQPTPEARPVQQPPQPAAQPAPAAPAPPQAPPPPRPEPSSEPRSEPQQ